MKIVTKWVLLVVVVALVAGALLNVTSYAGVSGDNQVVNYNAAQTSASSGGNQKARISEDGNIIMWTSSTKDVIPGDTHTGPAMRIYKRDMSTGAVSYAAFNTLGDPVSVSDSNFDMSRNGRYVVFSTTARNIVSSPVVPYNSNAVSHVYLADTFTNSISMVDTSISGVQANGSSDGSYALSVSDDGRFVSFASMATNLLASNNPTAVNIYIYVKDLQTGMIINPAVSNSGLRSDSVATRAVSSCDGSLLAFNSEATNLTPESSGRGDAYLVDIRNGYKIINLTYSANKSASVFSISCNGRYLVLSSLATNLTNDIVSGTRSHYFRYDRLNSSYELVDQSTNGFISNTYSPVGGYLENSNLVSDDGKVVFFSGEHNMVSPAATKYNLYVRNPELGTTEIVTINNTGVEYNAATGGSSTLSISARGNAVIYNTTATNLTSITPGNKLIRSSLD